MANKTLSWISLFLLLCLWGATLPEKIHPQAGNSFRPPDTLSVEAFKALFPYKGETLVPDSLDWIDCDFLLTFSASYWENGPFEWEKYRLRVEDEVVDLPFLGVPYSLVKRKGGGYWATFFFIEGEVSNMLIVKSLNEQFQVVARDGESTAGESLAYCGGDAGYEWYRDGYFVNDSVYLYRSIFLDEKYDTTWGSFIWDRAGKIKTYPLDVRPYLEDLESIPLMDLVRGFFPIKDSLVLSGKNLPEPLPDYFPPAYLDHLLPDSCDNPQGAFWAAFCSGQVRPLSYLKTAGTGYYLTFLDTWDPKSSLWLLAFSKNGNLKEQVLLERYLFWDQQIYSQYVSEQYLLVTQLQRGAWVEPDTIRVRYRLGEEGSLYLEQKETLIKPKP